MGLKLGLLLKCQPFAPTNFLQGNVTDTILGLFKLGSKPMQFDAMTFSPRGVLPWFKTSKGQGCHVVFMDSDFHGGVRFVG